jgi:hypothetical protein
MDDTALVLKIQGNDLEPQSLRAREVATLITAFEDAVAAVVVRRAPEIKRELVRVSLVAVENGSTVLTFSPNLQPLTVPAVGELANAIQRNSFFDLPTPAVEALREIVSFMKARNATATLSTGSREEIVEAVITPDLNVYVTTELTGYTTLYGEVLRLGGLDPKVEFKPFNGRVLFCPASKEIVLRLREHLYQPVAVHGAAVWDALTLEVTKFEIQDFDPFGASAVTGANHEEVAALREQFGSYFDKIDDVDAWVSAVRRGDI